MSSSGDFGNPLRKFKLVFLGEQSGMIINYIIYLLFDIFKYYYKAMIYLYFLIFYSW